MQLSKLHKNSNKLLKKFQKLKYLSLGAILPAAELPSPQKIAESMIDNDSCVHKRNSSQVLLSDFHNQIPKDGHTSRQNRLYAYFLKQINFLFEQYNTNSHIHSHVNTDNSASMGPNSNNNQGKDKKVDITLIKEQNKINKQIQKDGIIGLSRIKLQNKIKNANKAMILNNNAIRMNFHNNFSNVPVNIISNSYGSGSSNNTNNNSNSNKDSSIRESNTGNNMAKFKNKFNTKSKSSIVQQSLISIYEQVDKKHEIKKYRIQKLEKQIERMYVDCHQLYIQYMEIKNFVDTKMQQRLNIYNQQLSIFQKSTSRPQQIEEKSQILIQIQGDQSIKIRQSDYQITRQEPNSNSEPLLKKSKPILKDKSKEQRIKQQQLQQFNSKINNIKQAISKKQQTYLKLKEEERVIHQQKVGFLKLLLKNGYHTSDGIQWIMFKLAKNKQNLNRNDLYSILDDTTKMLILKDYQNTKYQLHYKIKKQVNLNSSNNTSSNKNLLPRINQNEQSKNQSRVQNNPQTNLFHYNRLINIPRTQNSMSIYRQTKKYLIDWVRQEKWKTRSLKHYVQQETSLQKSDWRQQEIKRLKKNYSKQTFQKMTKYIFGKTKYFSKFIIKKYEKGINKRKDSLTSNTSHSQSLNAKQKNYQHLKLRILTRTHTDK